MEKVRIIFFVTREYEVEGNDEEECVAKAEALFKKDCIYDYDDYQIEDIDQQFICHTIDEDAE